jgi:hypothetical protein
MVDTKIGNLLRQLADCERDDPLEAVSLRAKLFEAMAEERAKEREELERLADAAGYR